MNHYFSADKSNAKIMPTALSRSQNTLGNLYVISAPSGAGKSSLVKALLQQDEQLKLSISHTTRAPRGQEENGREYWFTTIDHFKQMIEQGDFVEWAHVHENYYGTSRQGIEHRLQQGNDVVLEIDWQGALQIKELFPQAVLIFILPPSYEELKARLQKRGEDSPEVIEKRLYNARIELSKAKDFDFVIINQVFETAQAELNSIVRVGRLRYNAQKNQQPKVFEQLGIANL